MKKGSKSFLTFIGVLLYFLCRGVLPVVAQPYQVWVDDDYCSSCPNDGHTWGYDAYDNINEGINAVGSPGTLHVAAGTYYENISMKNGVWILGAGQDVTTIDGGGTDTVVVADGVDSTARLEEFTITNGFAPNSAYGGGMFNINASPVVINCTFIGNSTDVWEWGAGGGMYNEYSSPTVTNCLFLNNTAEVGGGMYNDV